MSTRQNIVFAAFDGAQSLDLIGPLETLATARRLGGRNYVTVIASLGGGPITTSSGVRIAADVALERVRRTVDTLVVVGGDGTATAARVPAFVAAVARLSARARRVTSVCSGAFLLAAAGVLDGRRATTHWAHCATLGKMFPSVSVEPNSIFVRDGNVWTSAGVTAGMDMALALVEDDGSRDVALAVARQLVLFVRRPGGQAQFSAQLSGQMAGDDKLRELQLWIVENVAADLRVPRLAKRAGMSPRHFARVFRRDIGMAPAQFVERARVETVQRLLETTSLPLATIATEAGFATSDVCRRAFQRRVGITPRAYRTRFSPAPSAHSPTKEDHEHRHLAV